MARKKKAPNQGNDSMRAVSRKLWNVIRPHDWHGLLVEISPEYQWTMVNNHTITGCCPYHDDKTPSFTLHFNKRIGKCFGSCGKLVVDIVAMVAKLRHASYDETLIFLIARFSLSESMGKELDGLSEFTRLQEVKKAIAIAMNGVMTEYIRDKPEHLEYCRPAIVYLNEIRGLPIDVLPLLPIGIFPKPVHLRRHIPDASMHEEVLEYLKGYDNAAHYGAICYHYNDSPNTISRFKLVRMNMELLQGKGQDSFKMVNKDYGKGLFLTHSPVLVKDKYTSQVGLFGVYHYRHLIGSNCTDMYVSEGEMDVLSVMAAQLTLGVTDFMIFGTGGKGGTELGFMRDYGIINAYLVPDHPAKNGDSWALSVLHTDSNFTKKGDQTPLKFKVFIWPPEVTGMDLDEAVRQTGYDQLRHMMTTYRDRFFLDAMPWTTQKAFAEIDSHLHKFDQKIEEIDPAEAGAEIELENLQTARKELIKEKVVTWQGYFHSPAIQNTYLNKAMERYELRQEELENVASRRHNMGTVEGVAAYIMESLKEYLTPAYYTLTDRGINLHVWSIRNSELVNLPKTLDALMETMALIIGQPFTVWADKLLGDNEIYLSDCGDGSPTSLFRRKRNNLMNLFMLGLEMHYKELRNITNLIPLSQGIHYYDLPLDLQRERVVYFINGNHIFKGKFKEVDELVWERQDRVVDKNVYFRNLTFPKQWSSVTDTAMLEAANGLDLKSVFHKLVDILDGWLFEDHEFARLYLAAWIMSLPTMRATGQVNITLLTGDTSSGKSTFSRELVGRKYDSAIAAVLEPTLYNFASSAASMYHEADGSSLLFIVDEAEDSKEHNTRTDQQLKELTRLMYMIPHGGTSVKRSSPSQEVTEFVLRMPVLLSAIQIVNDPTFQNRTIIIKTKREDGRMDPIDYIKERYTDEDLHQLRQQVTICMLPHMMTIIQKKKDVHNRLKECIRGKIKVSNRIIDGVLSAMVILDMLEFNIEDLFLSMLLRNKSHYEAVYGSNTRCREMEVALFWEGIPYMIDDELRGYISPRQLILNDEYDELNGARCGVYVLKDEEQIVFYWPELRHKISKGLHSFAGLSEKDLKERAERHDMTVKAMTAEEVDYIRSTLQLHDMKSSMDISVVPMEYLVYHAQKPGRYNSDGLDDIGKPKGRAGQVEQPLELTNSEGQGVFVLDDLGDNIDAV